MLFRTQIGHTPCALKFVRVSPRSLKFRCTLPSSGWAGVMAWRCARFWVSACAGLHMWCGIAPGEISWGVALGWDQVLAKGSSRFGLPSCDSNGRVPSGVKDIG